MEALRVIQDHQGGGGRGRVMLQGHTHHILDSCTQGCEVSRSALLFSLQGNLATP